MHVFTCMISACACRCMHLGHANARTRRGKPTIDLKRMRARANREVLGIDEYAPMLEVKQARSPAHAAQPSELRLFPGVRESERSPRVREESESQRVRESESQRVRGSESHRVTESQSHRVTESQSQKDRGRNRMSDIERESQTYREGEREIEREREGERGESKSENEGNHCVQGD